MCVVVLSLSVRDLVGFFVFILNKDVPEVRFFFSILSASFPTN